LSDSTGRQQSRVLRTCASVVKRPAVDPYRKCRDPFAHLVGARAPVPTR
jgi:hypothetical protein